VGVKILWECEQFQYLTPAEAGRGNKVVYKPLLAPQFIDEDMEERIKALTNPDGYDPKKGKRHSSLQKKNSVGLLKSRK
jgi:hypothetical protein